MARAMGFFGCGQWGRFVRSSYHADEMVGAKLVRPPRAFALGCFVAAPLGRKSGAIDGSIH